MSIIYRVENIKGEGPYVKCKFYDPYVYNDNRWNNREHNLRNEAPEPFEDYQLKYEADHIEGEVFGFTSLCQLKRWFHPDELRRLQELGYNIVTYEGEIIAKSKYQCVFKRKHLLK